MESLLIIARKSIRSERDEIFFSQRSVYVSSEDTSQRYTSSPGILDYSLGNWVAIRKQDEAEQTFARYLLLYLSTRSTKQMNFTRAIYTCHAH